MAWPRDIGSAHAGRLSWADAGGAAPGIGAIDAGGGAVAAVLGTGAVQCLCANTYPWDLAQDDKLNLSFQYEAA